MPFLSIPFCTDSGITSVEGGGLVHCVLECRGDDHVMAKAKRAGLVKSAAHGGLQRKK